MKRIFVPKYTGETGGMLTAGLSEYMDSIGKESLEYTPWKAYPYKPVVRFSLAHTGSSLLLKFFVREGGLRAASGLLNGPVWEDSCVEFFIGMEDGKGYYNFEFNCIGNLRAGFGKDRNSRDLLPGTVLDKIQSEVLIRNRPAAGECYWELLAMIPSGVFLHDSIVSFNGVQCRANFYKCGDKLPEPHFVAWSDIVAPQPDFHLPEYFGALSFLDTAGTMA